MSSRIKLVTSNSNTNANSNSNSSSNSASTISELPDNNEEFSNSEYIDIDDVDYVRINVKGDGSCFYRSLFVAAYMYPLQREIILQQLLPEFAEYESLLIPVLESFGYTKTTLLNEEDAIKFMRKELARGILGKSHDDTINEVCNEHISSFYNSTVSALCESYISDSDLFRTILEEASYEIASFFKNITASKLSLKAFKKYLAENIQKTSTYASEFDVILIEKLLAKKKYYNITYIT